MYPIGVLYAPAALVERKIEALLAELEEHDFEVLGLFPASVSTRGSTEAAQRPQAIQPTPSLVLPGTLLLLAL